MMKKIVAFLVFFYLMLSASSFLIPSFERSMEVYAKVNYHYSETNEIDAPEGYELHGIDVSHYQQHIDWSIVNEQNLISFAIIKATEGNHFTDHYFNRNWKETKRNGIKRGAYHFFRPEVSGKEQAELYLSVVDFEEGDFAPVLDIEIVPEKGRDQWYKDIDAWLQTVEKETGKKPIIYSGRSFYTDFLQKRYSEYPIWIANYKRKDLPMEEWHLWQHTETAKMRGISGPVDHNVFNGTEADLAALCF